MRKYIDFVEGTDGRAAVGASVLVLTYPGNAVATLYADEGGTPLANPVTTDETGGFWFYANQGRYSLQITGTTLSPQTIDDVTIFDADAIINASAAGAAAAASASAASVSQASADVDALAAHADRLAAEAARDLAMSAVSLPSAAVNVSTRSQLASIGVPSALPALLSEAGLQGTFYFDSTNHWTGRPAFTSFSGVTVTTDTASGGQSVVKTGGTNNVYDAAAYINYTFVGDYELWVKPSQSQNIRLGVDASPISTAGFTDLDFATSVGGSLISFTKNGVSDGNVSVSSVVNWFCLTRISGVLYVYENSTRTLAGATLRKTFTGTMTGTHYAKASVFELGKGFLLVAVDTPNVGTGYVQADPLQAVYIAPSSDTTGKSGAWVRQLEANRKIRPEWFGAKGDGVTNDTAAFAAAAALLQAWGGGTLAFRSVMGTTAQTGATYIVGQQTFGSDPANYSYAPADIFRITGFSGHIKIEGNGATMKAAAGLRVGSFDPATGLVYTPPGGAFADARYMASPYLGMIYATAYTGTLEVENITLDGNAPNLLQGGYYGDTGFQIPCSGLQVLPGTGGLICRNVKSNYHATDGATYQAAITAKGTPAAKGMFFACDFHYNGRNGFSLTGGRGLVFEACSFSHTAKAGIASNPQYGFDCEPDGGSYARDITFINCRFLNNANGGYGGASGRMQEINFYDCRLDGTTGYALWVEKPGHKFHNCKITGLWAAKTWVENWNNGILEEGLPARFFDCIFTNNPLEFYDGAGPTYAAGTEPQIGSGVVMERCVFDYDSASNLRPGGGGGAILPIFRDCTILSNEVGVAQLSVQLEGTTTLTMPSGSISTESLPLQIRGRFIKNGTEWFTGSKVQDWPSIAAGASASTTVTVQGAVVGGARRYFAEMSIDSGGLVFSARASAANTVTVTAFNPTAGAIDLASGTLSVVGLR